MGRCLVCLFLILAIRLVEGLTFSAGQEVVDRGGQRQAVIEGWGEMDLSGVVVVRSPLGVPSSGALLAGGRHVLTAAHGVAGLVGKGGVMRGRVEVQSGGERKVIPWRRVMVHPKYRAGGAWDVAVVELSWEVPEGFAARYELARETAALPALILRAGWGKSGDGRAGETGKWGVLQAGLNRHELRAVGAVAGLFEEGSLDLPFLVSDFDGGWGEDAVAEMAAQAGLRVVADAGVGAMECHLANGDSGGPVFSRGDDGKPVLVAVQVGRVRRGADVDHRLNGTWGELAVDVEAARIRGWVRSRVFMDRQKVKPTTKLIGNR